MEKQIIFDFYNTLYDPKSQRLFRGTSNMLKKLKNSYNLSLVTTYSKNRQGEIRNLNLNKYFSKIIICRKKSTKVFQQLTKAFPSNLIIGDREEEEIRIGKILGAKTLKVNQKENPISAILRELGGNLL